MSTQTRTGSAVGVIGGGVTISCQCGQSPTSAQYPRSTGCLLCEAAGFDGDYCRHGVIVSRESYKCPHGHFLARDVYRCPITDSNYSPDALRAIRQDPLWRALVFGPGVYEPQVSLSVTRSTIYLGVNYRKAGSVKVEFDDLESLNDEPSTDYGRTESLRLQHALTPEPIRKAAQGLLACGFRFIGDDLQPPTPSEKQDFVKKYRPGLQDDTAYAIWHVHMVRGRLTGRGVPVGIKVNFEYTVEPQGNPTPWRKDDAPSAS